MARGLDAALIDEGEFKNFEMDLVIPSVYSSQFEYIEKFLNVDVNYFQQSSRDFVVQGELLKLFLVLKSSSQQTKKTVPKGKDKEDLASQPSIGYHVDVRLRNPDDFLKSSSPSSHSSSKTISKTIMISNPKHGHVRHTPTLNTEYDTETANNLLNSTATATTATATATMGDSDEYSSGSDAATATSVSSATATTITATTIPNSNNNNNNEDTPKGLLVDFVTINSPASTTKAKTGVKPNFFRLPDGTVVFPIEIPVGVKSKYNNKDISVVVSVARVMQPPAGVSPTAAAGGLTASGRFLGDNIFALPGSPTTSQQHITSATKLEKLLSTQYPQYWQYSQYSRGGVGNVLPPAIDTKSPFHNSYSNPNLFGMGTLTRVPSSSIMPTSTAASLSVPTLSSNNSRSDPNLSSLASTSSESGDTLSPLPNLLAPPTTSMTSRGSSGNLYGMGQLQTSTSSASISYSNVGAGSTSSGFNSSFGVSTSGPVAIKTAHKIVRVLEPLHVRLLDHFNPLSLKLGTRRLIPVAVSNTHPTLSITVRGLQMVLSNIPSLEGGTALTAGQVPDIPYNHVSVTDKYKTSTLDIETFPVSIVPGDEYHFVVAVEPLSPTSTGTPTPPPPPAPSNRSGGMSGIRRRVIHTLQAQLVITWSIPCSPGSILSIHPLPVSFPAPHDLLVSFDSKSPVRAHNVFNVCFTITNLSDYSRDLTFIIPRPVCVSGPSSSGSSSTAAATPTRAPLSVPRSPPTRASTLPVIRFTAASASTSSLPTITTPTPHSRTPSFSGFPSVTIAPPALNNSAPLPQTQTQTQPQQSQTQTSSPRSGSSGDIDEDELLVRFGELQSNSASMLCLEKTLYVGLVKSNSSVSVNVRYIPMREGLFEIQGLQIFDRATDQVYMVQDTCQLYVIA